MRRRRGAAGEEEEGVDFDPEDVERRSGEKLIWAVPRLRKCLRKCLRK
jgi:hypothetical protein